jgi:hypothetical protein
MAHELAGAARGVSRYSAPNGLQRGAALLDYSRGGNRGYDIARVLRDYLVRVEPGSDELLLGKAFFVVAGRRLANATSSSNATGRSPTPPRSSAGDHAAGNRPRRPGEYGSTRI